MAPIRCISSLREFLHRVTRIVQEGSKAAAKLAKESQAAAAAALLHGPAAASSSDQASGKVSLGAMVDQLDGKKQISTLGELMHCFHQRINL